MVIEPEHDKVSEMPCALSKDSDQPGHLPRQIRVFAFWVSKDPSILQTDSENINQTGQIPRLIRVFAWHTGHFVGFVVRRFIYLPKICLK